MGIACGSLHVQHMFQPEDIILMWSQMVNNMSRLFHSEFHVFVLGIYIYIYILQGVTGSMLLMPPPSDMHADIMSCAYEDLIIMRPELRESDICTYYQEACVPPP